MPHRDDGTNVQCERAEPRTSAAERRRSFVDQPQRLILISRGIMLKGVGLGHLWQETLVLVGMTLVLLVAAVRKFNVRLD